MTNSTSTKSNNTTATDKQSSPNSFGATLRRAREQQKISLDDVAKDLFILKRHLEALENEDFAALPQEAFARGFAIKYAKHLDLDPHEMADSFDAAYPDSLKVSSVEDIHSPMRPLGTVQRGSRRSLRINPLLVFAAIGLLVLGIFLLRTVGNARDEQQANIDEVNVNDNISGLEQIEGAAISSSVDLNNTENLDNLGNNGSAIGMVDSSSATSTLEFWVRKDTSIEVIDASGNRLLTGKQSRGSYKLVGKPPFRIQIDPASNVTLDMNNQKIRMADYITNDKANFTLP